MSESSESWRPATSCGSFPLMRLLGVYRYALDARRVAMAFLAIALIAIVGKALDTTWLTFGYGEKAGISTQGAIGSARSGPFATLVAYEARCVGEVMRGAWSGHWGADGDEHASVIGGALHAMRGIRTLIAKYPFFAILFFGASLVALGLCGGAICRSAVCEMGCDRVISVGEAIDFAKARLSGLVMPVVTVALLTAGLLGALWLWGLVFGWLSSICAGGLFLIVFALLFGVSLLIGFIAATMAILTMVGFPLIWPAVAAEGSGGADALSRAIGFLTTRPGLVLASWLILLILGGVAITGARLVGSATLNLTHATVGARMSALDEMWAMPERSGWLPDPDVGPFWGDFPPTDSTARRGAQGLIKIWVFCVVGLVAAYCLSFWMCGASQAYLLIRRSIDGVDCEDIFDDNPPAGVTDVSTATTPPSGEGATD
ncbi:MAG: hypothetical protein KDA32_04520 [Phycisphaerales bacterium]|nr:hypothetical protein [Phycisphaerales bacterium]